MIPRSNRNSKSSQKQILSLITNSVVGPDNSNIKTGGSKKKGKTLTEAQEAVIKKLDKKSKTLLGIIGDENTEYQGTW